MDNRAKTIFCDIDGTLIEHGAATETTKPDFNPKLLSGTVETLLEWDKKGYNIILVSGRREGSRSQTERQLSQLGIIYDQLILGIGGGKRYLINDRKPNNNVYGLDADLAGPDLGVDDNYAIAINIDRNKGIGELRYSPHFLFDERHLKDEFAFERYANDGWGLSSKGFKQLFEIIANHEKKVLNVIDFGSGTSTQFLIDMVNLGIKKMNIESYDNSTEWCYPLGLAENHDFLNLKIRRLMECDDYEFMQMFIKKTYNKDAMHPRTAPSHTRQKNCFYEILEEDLKKEEYDLVLLDGPNGNGRSIAFLHLMDALKPGCFIYIDDYDHHAYLGCLRRLFDVEVYSYNKVGNYVGSGDAYIICKIISKRDDSE